MSAAMRPAAAAGGEGVPPASGTDRPDWARDGASWPNRDASRFVSAAGIPWHVQAMGAGPPLLLVHGTGAATHSWRDLAPLLAPDFRVVAPDLPGHGFTGAPPARRMALSAMARDLGALLDVLDVRPEIVVGHSAGAAILIRMALDGIIAPRLIVSLNGALLPFRGLAGAVFAPLARLLFVNPLVPRLFAWRAADDASTERLIRNTGSEIGPEGVALYAKLLRHPAHARAALAMMAHWDLDTLVADMPRLDARLLLVAGGNDRAVPPENAATVRDRVPGATVRYMRGVGHLAHEEAPEAVADIIRAAARDAGVPPRGAP
jgi:magnesium chelatase accessory protein